MVPFSGSLLGSCFCYRGFHSILNPSIKQWGMAFLGSFFCSCFFNQAMFRKKVGA